MTDRLAGLVLPDNTPVDDLPEAPAPKPAKKPRPVRVKRPRRAGSYGTSDWAIVGAGLALAFACAVFPWYIFFNQEQFGTRPVTFHGNSALTLPADGDAAQPQLVGERMAMPGEAFPDLDMASTGTVAPGGPRTASAAEQPYPTQKPDFDLVLVANGRAMIRDKDGFWVVQPGSWLPDGSRVSTLEKRAGKWVLVTSSQAVVTLTE